MLGCEHPNHGSYSNLIWAGLSHGGLPVRGEPQAGLRGLGLLSKLPWKIDLLRPKKLH